MTGYIKIENTTAQQVNYDDIAVAHGWTGTGDALDENGNPIINIVDGRPMAVDGSMIQQIEISSQEFIARMYKKFSDQLATKACNHQETLKGKLNYDAAARIKLFKETTKVTWEE
jgi:hypothetical protein